MNILTFDIEDWWVYDYYKIGNRSDYLPRLNFYLSEILDLLDKRNFKATFFCLGEVARNNPEIIKRIHSRGHHIGCHSYNHRFIFDLTPEEFNQDTKLALKCIEDVIGIKVDSYRAPAFSITQKSIWALNILAENGIKNDCSIYPYNRGIGGFSSFSEKMPTIIKTSYFEIKEFPMSSSKFFGKNLSFSGGGYFRLTPYYLIKNCTMKSKYIMTYFHIKDFDYMQEKKVGLLKEESRISRYFKDYYGLKKSYNKFQKYLNDFEFISVKQASDLIDWSNVKVIHLT